MIEYVQTGLLAKSGRTRFNAVNLQCKSVSTTSLQHELKIVFKMYAVYLLCYEKYCDYVIAC